jgi:tyrosyl-tRNA synthetase
MSQPAGFNWGRAAAAAAATLAVAGSAWGLGQLLLVRKPRCQPSTSALASPEPDAAEVFVAPTQAELDAQWALIARHLSPHQLDGDGAEGLAKMRTRLEPVMRVRRLHIYWGTAPTSTLHVGYLRPLGKLADFLRAGCHVTILLADLHATLDARKSSWDKLEVRSSYYSAMLLTLLSRMGAPLEHLSFVHGWAQLQSQPAYIQAFLDLSSYVTPAAAKKASAEVVKKERDPKLSALVRGNTRRGNTR